MPTSSINWEADVVALRDMSVTAHRNHEIATLALIQSLASPADDSEGVLKQKVLMAKVAAESVAALESLGAIASAISKRFRGGILDAYLKYQVSDAKSIYRRATETRHSARTILRIPSDARLKKWLSQDERRRVQESLLGVRRTLSQAGRNYLKKDQRYVRAYNKIKHGFLVLQRPDLLLPNVSPPTDWRSDVNILTGITPDGSVQYIALSRSQEMIEHLEGNIKACASCWKELASLMIYLHERGVPLGQR